MLDRHPIFGATGTLSFGLRITLPVGFKAKMVSSSPVFFLLLVHNNPESQLWLSGPDFSNIHRLQILVTDANSLQNLLAGGNAQLLMQNGETIQVLGSSVRRW